MSTHEQWNIAENSLQSQQKNPHFVSTSVEHTSLVHPRGLPRYVSLVQVPESCYPLLSCLIFRPLFLAELLNRYQSVHAKSKRHFALALKVAPDSNIQQWSIADNSPQSQQRNSHFVSTPVEHTSLVHPRGFPRYVSRVQILESCCPLLSYLIFRPLFLAELLNRYHNAHAESERHFALALKVASDPNIQQLSTTNKIAFPFPSIVV